MPAKSLSFLQRKYLLRLQSQAIQENAPGWSSRYLPTLNALKRRAFVERVEDEFGAAWQITSAGLSAVE